MKIKLALLAHNGGPFNCLPARDIELDDNDVLTNDVIFPWEYNPNHVYLYAIGNEFGAVCACWGSAHDILDVATDLGMMGSFASDDEHFGEHVKPDDENWECGCAFLGNASEPHNIDYCWIQRVDVSKLDAQTLCKFAEARGQGATSLYL